MKINPPLPQKRLHYCIEMGYIEVIELFYRSGMLQIPARTLVVGAAMWGRFEILKFLVSIGAEKDDFDMVILRLSNIWCQWVRDRKTPWL